MFHNYQFKSLKFRLFVAFQISLLFLSNAFCAAYADSIRIRIPRVRFRVGTTKTSKRRVRTVRSTSTSTSNPILGDGQNSFSQLGKALEDFSKTPMAQQGFKAAQQAAINMTQEAIKQSMQNPQSANQGGFGNAPPSGQQQGYMMQQQAPVVQQMPVIQQAVPMVQTVPVVQHVPVYQPAIQIVPVQPNIVQQPVMPMQTMPMQTAQSMPMAQPMGVMQQPVYTPWQPQIPQQMQIQQQIMQPIQNTY